MVSLFLRISAKIIPLEVAFPSSADDLFQNLNENERTRVESYLAIKYGITRVVTGLSETAEDKPLLSPSGDGLGGICHV